MRANELTRSLAGKKQCASQSTGTEADKLPFSRLVNMQYGEGSVGVEWCARACVPHMQLNNYHVCMYQLYVFVGVGVCGHVET